MKRTLIKKKTKLESIYQGKYITFVQKLLCIDGGRRSLISRGTSYRITRAISAGNTSEISNIYACSARASPFKDSLNF
jgi:hypothetical protein